MARKKHNSGTDSKTPNTLTKAAIGAGRQIASDDSVKGYRDMNELKCALFERIEDEYGVIGQKELVKNPATLVESSVAGFLSSLKQDEGWTKRVGEKCFKPLIYKAFLCLHLP